MKTLWDILGNEVVFTRLVKGWVTSLVVFLCCYVTFYLSFRTSLSLLFMCCSLALLNYMGKFPKQNNIFLGSFGLIQLFHICGQVGIPGVVSAGVFLIITVLLAVMICTTIYDNPEIWDAWFTDTVFEDGYCRKWYAEWRKSKESVASAHSSLVDLLRESGVPEEVIRDAINGRYKR